MSGTSPTVPWTRVCYGVDLQQQGPVVVRGERTRRGRITWSTEAPPDRPSKRGSDGPVFVGAIDARKSFLRWIEAPYTSRRKARKVLPTVLDLQLPFELDQCRYTLPLIRVSRGAATRAMAVGARIADLESALQAYEAAGFDPVVLDHEGLALWTQSLREVPMASGSESGLRVVVWLSPGHTTVCIGRGRALHAAHGLTTADPAHIRRLVYAQVEALSQDQPSGPDRHDKLASVHWLWAGPGVRDERAWPALRDELVQHWAGRSDTHKQPSLLLARALATRALLPEPLPCNLRSGSIAHPVPVARRDRRTRLAAAAVGLSGLMLSAAAVGTHAAVAAREHRMEADLAALRDRLAGFHVKAKGAHAVRVVEDAVQDRIEKTAFFVEAGRPSLSFLLNDITRLGNRLGLRYTELALTGRSIHVKGTAPDWRNCDPLIQRLRQAGYAAELQRQNVLVDDVIPFTIVSGGPDA